VIFMGRFVLFLLVAVSQVLALEIGIKLGNSRVNWSGSGSTTLESFFSIYGEHMFSPTTFLSFGPSFEFGYGKERVGLFYCPGYGTCQLEFTYTTVELNGKARLNASPTFGLYGGVGISTNRFGVDAKDTRTGNTIGTIRDENTAGAQAFFGMSGRVGPVGTSLEYKYKVFDTDRIDSVDTLTLNLFLNF